MPRQYSLSILRIFESMALFGRILVAAFAFAEPPVFLVPYQLDSNWV